MLIEHVVPQFGYREIPLRPPADALYKLLEEVKEVNRLKGLRHLGSVARAMNGVNHYRWDYTAALLLYGDELKLPGFNARFRIGDTSFSSTNAALQSLALIWNVGHLPGTYSVEKGLFRAMVARSPSAPAEELGWPRDDEAGVRRIIARSNEILLKNDSVALARVLSVRKALLFALDDDWLMPLTTQFLAPMILRYEGASSGQWPKLRRAWEVVRHLSYLTMDGPLSGAAWAPSIRPLVEEEVARETADLARLAERTADLLGPVQRMTYERLYHHPKAQVEAALAAAFAERKAAASNDFPRLVDDWAAHSLERDLRLDRRPRASSVKRVVSLRLRGHRDVRPSTLESQLVTMGFEYPLVQSFDGWRSGDESQAELLIDVLSSRSPDGRSLGRVLTWFYSNFDKSITSITETEGVAAKRVLEVSYRDLVDAAVRLKFPAAFLRFEPWPLREFGIGHSSPAVFAFGPTLDDPLLGYVLRDRTAKVDPELRERYAEVRGLFTLRRHLRRRYRGARPRARWLALLGSIRVARPTSGQARHRGRGVTDVAEFDGGFVRVSSRSGRITFFGLETKSGQERPLRALRKRLGVLGIEEGAVSELSRDHAYAEIDF